jgi:hypothetical protein
MFMTSMFAVFWCKLSVVSCEMSSMERLLEVGAFFLDLWLARRLDFCRVANNNNIHKKILALCEFFRLRRSVCRTMLERHWSCEGFDRWGRMISAEDFASSECW